MPEDVRQLKNIGKMLHIRQGKKVPEAMGIDLVLVDSYHIRHMFKHFPYRCPADRRSRRSPEYCSALNAFLPAIFMKQGNQVVREINFSCFSLIKYLDISFIQNFNRNILQLADPYACQCDNLHDQIILFPAAFLCIV